MRIARRKRIADLRLLWRTETTFSDWLTSEEGKGALAEDVGLELENLVRECRPGDFPCDVVGNLVGDSDHKVIVENQFGRTDHDHLGKFLTYAAVNGALTGIWIAERVADDHRKVIDWLNDNTADSINLYLAELRVYQIEDSAAAPEILVVSRPNLQVKAARAQANSATVERQHFWSDVREYLESSGFPYRLSARVDVGPNFQLGQPGFVAWLGAPFAEKRVACGVQLKVAWKVHAFNMLKGQKEQIEREIGHTLEWKPSSAGYTLIMLHANLDPGDLAQRNTIKEWFDTTGRTVLKVLESHIRSLMPPSGEKDKIDVQEGSVGEIRDSSALVTAT